MYEFMENTRPPRNSPDDGSSASFVGANDSYQSLRNFQFQSKNFAMRTFPRVYETIDIGSYDPRHDRQSSTSSNVTSHIYNEMIITTPRGSTDGKRSNYGRYIDNTTPKNWQWHRTNLIEFKSRMAPPEIGYMSGKLKRWIPPQQSQTYREVPPRSWSSLSSMSIANLKTTDCYVFNDNNVSQRSMCNSPAGAKPSNYETIEEIGKGGFAVVYLVKNKDDDVYVVKKVDQDKASSCPSSSSSASSAETIRLRKMIRDEAKLMMSLNNRNIVKAYDYFIEDRFIYISMEYCEKGTLSSILEEYESNNKEIEESLLMFWFAQLVSVLKYLHNNKILHRDIKCENIFVTSNRKVVKLGDFGIARCLNPGTTGTKSVIGTIEYMPPELLNGKSYNFKSEVWALGIVMYELMAQKMPFDCTVPGAVIKSICTDKPVPKIESESYSKDLRDYVVEKMLSKDQRKRPAMKEIICEDFVLQAIAEMANMEDDSEDAFSESNSDSESSCTESSSEASSDEVTQVMSIPEVNTQAMQLLKAAEEGIITEVNRGLNSISPKHLVDPATWVECEQNPGGETPLHVAVKHVGVFRILWSSLGSGLGRYINVNGRTPLEKAVEEDQIDVIDFLVNQDQTFLYEGDAEHGRSILHLAAVLGNLNLVKRLVELHKADIFIESGEDDGCELPIHLSAFYGHLKIVEFFISYNEEIEEEENGDGELPIHKAALGGRIPVVDYFIEQRSIGVEVKATQSGWGLLHFAAENGHLDLVRRLVENYLADIKAKSSEDEDGEFSIHVAAEFGHLPIIDYLLTLDNSLGSLENSAGCLPIHKAAQADHIDIVDYFLVKPPEFNVDTKNSKNGKTCLHYAAKEGNLELVRKLVELYKADIMAKVMISGNTAIHLAAQFGRTSVVKYLASRNKDLVLVANNKGETPNDLAQRSSKKGSKAVTEFLTTVASKC